MPKNRHLTFGDMQAQKSREQHLAKLRAMMKPAEGEQQAETPNVEPVPAPVMAKPVPKAAAQSTASAGKSTPPKKAAKPAPKKAAKKTAPKKKGKR